MVNGDENQYKKTDFETLSVIYSNFFGTIQDFILKNKPDGILVFANSRNSELPNDSGLTAKTTLYQLFLDQWFTKFDEYTWKQIRPNEFIIIKNKYDKNVQIL